MGLGCAWGGGRSGQALLSWSGLCYFPLNIKTGSTPVRRGTRLSGPITAAEKVAARDGETIVGNWPPSHARLIRPAQGWTGRR